MLAEEVKWKLIIDDTSASSRIIGLVRDSDNKMIYLSTTSIEYIYIASQVGMPY